MNEKQIMQQQANPYAEFEPAFDMIPLPSEGLFYPEVDGEKVTEAKVYHLTAEDEGIMTSPNLIKSGNILDVLLEKKVKCKIPVSKLLVGDRLAILIYLRATMEQIYKIPVVDPETNKEFIYELDLATLEMEEITELPDQNGLFEFLLPKSKKRVKFRMMTGEDEKIIRMRQKQEQNLRKTDESLYTLLKMEQTIVQIEGINDRMAMAHFIKNMPLMDSRKLLKYMNDVSPKINLDLEIPTPSGGRFRKMLPITAEFFYPTL